MYKSNKTIILSIIMLVTKNNPQEYKEHVVLFIEFPSGGGATIIYQLVNMKIYFSYIEESYKYTIVGHLLIQSQQIYYYTYTVFACMRS